MEDFIKDYVNSILEANELELDNSKINNIVNNICNDEELWNYVDSVILETIARETNNN